MTKQEKIRQGLSKQLFQIDEGIEVTDEWWAKMCDREWSNAIVSSEHADIILSYLHPQGVVIKVERESQMCSCCGGSGMIGGSGINDCCPECNGTGKIYCVGYVAVESLI